MRDEKGRFVKGDVPWNKGIPFSLEVRMKMSANSKGIHKSPQTEFKRGESSPRKGRGKGWLDRKGYRKIMHNGIDISEHQYIWCNTLGNLPYIPEGFVVHHINTNKIDNRPENLVLLPKKYHDFIHANIRRKKCQILTQEV